MSWRSSRRSTRTTPWPKAGGCRPNSDCTSIRPKAARRWTNSRLGWPHRSSKRKVEPNSGLGEAIAYMDKHWNELTLFLRQACSPPGQQCMRTGPQKGDPAPQERLLLQDRQRGPRGRPVHELDPHLRTERRQSLRLPDRVAQTRQGAIRQPGGLDALELPGHGQERAAISLPAVDPCPRDPQPASTNSDFSRLPKGHDVPLRCVLETTRLLRL